MGKKQTSSSSTPTTPATTPRAPRTPRPKSAAVMAALQLLEDAKKYDREKAKLAKMAGFFTGLTDAGKACVRVLIGDVTRVATSATAYPTEPTLEVEK